MKMTKCILLIFTVIAFVGCGVENRSPDDVKYFLLDVERPAAKVPIKSTASLCIRPCRVSAAFAGRSLVYRTNNVLYEQDYYNLFLTNPDDQLTDMVRAWFRKAGFSDCISGDQSRSEQYTLESRVDILCADFTDKENTIAIVKMHVLVTAPDKEFSSVKTILEKTYSAETHLPQKPTAAQVVEGLSNSISEILEQNEKDLAEILSFI